MKKLLPQSIKNPQGFTLIELMVVIAIIAILSVIGITIFSGAQKNSRDAKRKGDIEAISSAIEAHINNTLNGSCTGAAGTYCAPLGTIAWFASGAIPVDPSTAASYTGLPVNGATTYTVCATLENPVSQFCRSNQQ